MKKKKKVWTAEERKAFGEKMKAARAKKGVKQPKPKKSDIPIEVKELSGISEPGNVNVYIPNPINVNGVSYGGLCNVPVLLAQELKYRSDLVSGRRAKEQDSTNHVVE